MPKKLPDFQNFGEYLYYAYANLQMLHYALKDGKPRYDRKYARGQVSDIMMYDGKCMMAEG